MPDQTSGFSDLIQLIQTLRGEGGCSWDRMQTPLSLSQYLLEEVYELIDAIASGSADAICEELGDVLFHIFFLAHLFHEKDQFDIHAVARKITAKMKRRHPHVFGNEAALDTAEIIDQWHRIKKEEKKNSAPSSVLDSVPAALPALIRAHQVSERAARSGFDWDDISGVLEKAEEEWQELTVEVFSDSHSQARQTRCAHELGDVLFTLVNVARFLSIHPETALLDATRKFERRFRAMEQILSKRQTPLDSLPTHELNALWEEAKAKTAREERE